MQKRNIYNLCNKQNKLSIIIDASFIKRGMRTYGLHSLLNITKTKKLIDLQLEIIHKKFKDSDHEVIIVAGFQAEKLMNHIPSEIIAIENERFEETNQMRSISLALRASTGNRALLINSEIYFNSKSLDLPYEAGSCAILKRVNEGIKHHCVSCVIENNLIQHMTYGLPNVWEHIIYLDNIELNLLKKIAHNKNKEKIFLFEGINDIIDNEGKITPYYNNEINIVQINKISDIYKI